MVFTEIVKQFDYTVKLAVDELFDKAYSNQREKTDLLLIIMNGFYDEENASSLISKGYSPYVIGPADMGHSEATFYELFDSYRRMTCNKEEFDNSLRDTNLREQIEKGERFSINMELLIYLKFWESDLLLSQLYNLSNLVMGINYDWRSSKLIDARMTLIRKNIQEPIETDCPRMYELISNIYSNQVRNAIAHSKYYFMGRSLILANKKDNIHYELYNLSFDDWAERFHKTILLYNHFIGNINKYNQLYQDEVKDKHYGLAVYTPQLTSNGLRKQYWVKYDKTLRKWLWSSQFSK